MNIDCVAMFVSQNYEIDSLCYFVKLSYQYWKTVGEDDIFDEEWKSAVELIIKTWRIEQDHAGIP